MCKCSTVHLVTSSSEVVFLINKQHLHRPVTCTTLLLLPLLLLPASSPHCQRSTVLLQYCCSLNILLLLLLLLASKQSPSLHNCDAATAAAAAAAEAAAMATQTSSLLAASYYIPVSRIPNALLLWGSQYRSTHTKARLPKKQHCSMPYLTRQHYTPYILVLVIS